MWKSRTQETLNISMCADSSTVTKTDINRETWKRKRKNMSSVMCQVSHVTCHVSRVACHLSLTPTAKATDPCPASSPTVHSRLVCTDPTKWKFQNALNHWDSKRYASISDMLFDQKSPVHREAGFPNVDRQTDIQVKDVAAYRLNWPRDRFSENHAKRCQ